MSTVYIYFDESGDLGFDFSNKGTSRWFIATFLICTDPKPVHKAVKSAHAALVRSLGRRHTGVFHAHKDKDSTKKRLLKELKKKDFAMVSARVDKHTFRQGDCSENVLYALIANFLLQQIRKDFNGEDVQIIFIASRRFTKTERNKEFKDLLEKADESDSFPKVSVSIKKPHEDRALQAVDLISWSLYQKFEKGNSEFIDILEDKVVVNYEILS